MAQRNAESFKELSCRPIPTSSEQEEHYSTEDNAKNYLRASLTKAVCYFCGKSKHPRHLCPAKNVACNYSNKVGHFYKICQKRIADQRESNTDSKLNAIFGVKLATI